MDQKDRYRISAIITFTESLMVLRDPFEDGHQKRCANNAMRLAAEMKLSNEDVELIGFAARLHDVGKIVIAESVLNKPKLTIAEKNMINSHSMLGALIITSMGFDNSLPVIIFQHHENWDGSGYPLKLSGEDILIGARILRIVDCFDAMTNIRSYREFYTYDRALSEMQKESGTSFDPTIYEIFERMIKA